MLLQSVPINMEIKWRFLYRLCSTRRCNESMDRASWTVCINTVERRTGRYTKYIFSFLGYYYCKLFRISNFSCTTDKTINIEITGIGNSKMWSIIFEPLKSWFPLIKKQLNFSNVLYQSFKIKICSCLLGHPVVYHKLEMR